MEEIRHMQSTVFYDGNKTKIVLELESADWHQFMEVLNLGKFIK